MLDIIDKQILLEISGDLNIGPDLFQDIGLKIGITNDDLFMRLRKMQSEGILKRIAPIIRHYNTDYSVNAMVVWVIENGSRQTIDDMINKYTNISHVYERKSYKNWPFNFYTMIHGQSIEVIEGIVNRLEKELGSNQYKILYTKQQWKKTSPDLNYYLEKE